MIKKLWKRSFQTVICPYLPIFYIKLAKFSKDMGSNSWTPTSGTDTELFDHRENKILWPTNRLQDFVVHAISRV